MSALAAQDRQEASSETRFYKSAGATSLGTVRPGVPMIVGTTQGDWTQLTIDGWIIDRSLGPTDREGFNVGVTPAAGENMRDSPGGKPIGFAVQGALFEKVESRGGWTHVRRTAWVQRAALRAPGAVAASRTEPSPAPVTLNLPVPEATPRDTAPKRPEPAPRVRVAPPPADRRSVTRATDLLEKPEGKQLGALAPGTDVRVLARAGDWTRVQVEAWIRDTDLGPSRTDALTGVTAAEVRADPARYTGQQVEWRVQYIALRKADELRPEMPQGQSYLLARGPLPEAGFVYVMLSSDQLARFQEVEPLQEFTIRAVIRAATTKYLPNPVVELVEVVAGT